MATKKQQIAAAKFEVKRIFGGVSSAYLAGFIAGYSQALEDNFWDQERDELVKILGAYKPKIRKETR